MSKLFPDAETSAGGLVPAAQPLQQSLRAAVSPGETRNETAVHKPPI